MRRETLAVVATLLTATLILLFGGWWTSHRPTDTPAPTTVKPQPVSSVRKALLTAQAADFERATREWGVDPALADTTGLGSPQLIDQMRTPADWTPPALDALSRLSYPDTAGPLAKSPECRSWADSDDCRNTPTGVAHQRRQHWTMGVRLTATPKVTVTGPDEATASGTVRVIVWSGTHGARTETMPDGSHWWHLTPTTGLARFEDRLRFDAKGRVVRRTVVTRPAVAFADPLAADWTGDMAAGLAALDDYHVADIPMEGDPPVLDVAPDSGVTLSAVEPTSGSTAWNDIQAAHGLDLSGSVDGRTQNP